MSPDVNYFLGRAYLDEGDANKALAYLRTAARSDANRADYQLYLGWAASEANQQAEAEKAIDAALDLDATLADAYWQRGVLLQRKGKVNEALIDLTLAVEKAPLRFEAYAAMAICYGELTQQDKAEDAWRMAVAGRSVPEWHYRLAKLLLTKGNKDEAAEHLEKASDGAAKIMLERKLTVPPPWFADANYHLGEVLRAKKKERAIKAFRDYLKYASPDDAYRKDAEGAIVGLGGRLVD
jgi:tetratricopeptide (TPR) repeat protein